MEQTFQSFEVLDAIVAGLLNINKKAVIGITSDNLFGQNLFNDYLESHLDNQGVLSVAITDGCVTKFYNDLHNEDTFVLVNNENYYIFEDMFLTLDDKDEVIDHGSYLVDTNDDTKPVLFNSDENIRNILAICYNYINHFYSISEDTLQELSNQEDNRIDSIYEELLEKCPLELSTESL
jgi:hypothetical protein